MVEDTKITSPGQVEQSVHAANLRKGILRKLDALLLPLVTLSYLLAYMVLPPLCHGCSMC